MKKLLLATVVAAGVATGAQANEFDVSGYVQGSVGQTRAKTPDFMKEYQSEQVAFGEYATDDKNKIGYKFLVGLQLNQFIGLEAQYVDLGESKYNTTDTPWVDTDKFKANGFGFNLVGTLPVTDQFKVFAKVGQNRLKAKWDWSFTSAANGSDSGSESATKWSTSYGAGMAVSVNESLDLVGEYETYRKVGKVSGYHIDLISAGIRYKF